MLFNTYLAAGFLASGVLAGVTRKPFRCSAPEMTPERKALNKQFALQEAESLRAGQFATQLKADIPVNVYLHSVSAKTSTLLSV
jgi:hypothetical protein